MCLQNEGSSPPAGGAAFSSAFSKLSHKEARNEMSKKYAVVDLGSNTIRLSAYNVLDNGDFDLLFSEKEMAGLVSYVHGGVLSPEGIQRACGAIRDFQALLRQFDLDAPHVFATASLRNIRNTEEAVEQIRAATGVGVDVISGELDHIENYKTDVVEKIDGLTEISQNNAASTEETAATMDQLAEIVEDCRQATTQLNEIAGSLNANAKKFQLG